MKVGEVSKWGISEIPRVIVVEVDEDGGYCKVSCCNENGVRKRPDAKGVSMSREKYYEMSGRTDCKHILGLRETNSTITSDPSIKLLARFDYCPKCGTKL